MNIVICVVNAFARIGVRAILDEHADLKVLAETDSAEALCLPAGQAGPDIAIIDAAIALRTTAMARLAGPAGGGPAVIALVGDIRARRLAELLRHGIRGIVSSDDAPGHLIQAVRAAAAGGIYISPVLAGRLAHAVTAPPQARAMTRQRVLLEHLTPRETEILGFVAEGKSNQEIADQLTLSEKTVKFHVSSILAKSDVRSRAQLIASVANLPDGPDGAVAGRESLAEGLPPVPDQSPGPAPTVGLA